METTAGSNAAADEARRESIAPRLSAGEELPIAFVVSIADDLLAQATEGSLRIEDVAIGADGVARLLEPAGAAAIAALFVRLLGDSPPPRALPLIARIEDEGFVDAESLRIAIRAALGAPAPHDELARAFAPPVDLGAAEDAVDFAQLDQPTEIMPSPPSESESEDFEVPILSAIPAPITAPPQPARPVVRHQLPKPNVRLPAAPAARRSAKPVADPRDSLKIPDDRPHWGAWIFVVLLVVVGVLFWLRYL
jgi:hypothetical protein